MKKKQHKAKRHGIKTFIISILILFFLYQPLLSETGIILTPEEQKWISQNHKVRVRVANWPPFMFSEDELKGIAVDYIKKIFERHRIACELIPDTTISWDEALKAIKKHEIIDLIPVAKITEERQKDMIFTDEYLFLPWVIFNRKESPFVGGMEDLSHKTVCVPKGYVMHGLLESGYPDIKLHILTGPNLVPRCMEALALGEVDAYVGNLAVGSYIIQDNGYTNVKVAAPTPFGPHNQAMAVRNDWPELVSIINKNLKAFTPKEHSEIKNKWLSIRYEHGLRQVDLLKWILGILGVSICIVSMFWFWNKRLNKEISERQQYEKKLKEKNKELARSNQYLQDFAFVASHDLQEPLRMVASYTQLLQERYQGQLDEKADKFINYASDGARRMQGLIDGLLNFSRIATHGREFTPVDVNQVVDRAIANLSMALDEAGATVSHDDLPVVTGDEGQLIQLIQNLVSNAIKFKGEDAPRVHISARKDEEDSNWIFSVQDNGIGIEEKYKEKIFVIFQRLHSRSAYPGTGIGLSLCRRIVQRHSGEIWFESKEGQGTTFYFTIHRKDY